ncbi:MAG: hypothetical protein NTX06_08425, partial [Proteobacteria bacterium]|nr:hypothetical protein [Pseudomonadota bacterium]
MRRLSPHLQKKSVVVIEQMAYRIKQILAQKPGKETFASGGHKRFANIRQSSILLLRTSTVPVQPARSQPPEKAWRHQ